MSVKFASAQPEESQSLAAERGICARSSSDAELLERLAAWFASGFYLFDGATGELLDNSQDQPAAELAEFGPLARAVADRGQAECLEDEEPLMVLAIPFGYAGRSRVAVGIFVTSGTTSPGRLERAARRLARSPREAERWIARQTCWAPHVLLSMGQLATERLAAERHVAALETEIRVVSLEVSKKYEEISLLYRLTQNLKLSSNDEKLGRLALEWLAEALPAESLAIQLTPMKRAEAVSGESRVEPLLLTHGPCPIDLDDVTRLVEHHGLAPGQRPLVVNPPATLESGWPWPRVRQLVVVSLCEGENCFGWLMAINHAEGGQFGTVEASLLSSVAAILGIHSGNAELYQQQREFFAGVVRALTSAIDAKDPYTCGHSDRVARVAARLAEELGCDRKHIDTIYLSGLLHDVGKIGIDDTVLRKPGKLTDEEYEHIKTHAEIGYKILVDIKQLDEVLPVVLHHHEQWDGRGYPRGLAGEAIPFLARIVAVADSFDAMGSDRPYRKGMSDEKLDAILRDGAAKQWDAAVVDAFFRARDDIREIAHQPVKRVTLDLVG